ncbi:hypothetical protein TNCV_4148351 [Trichonephila clavipes]|nr:hypothetical protein TNCV_4148351 [Trichonephila clavipes]
MGFLRIYVLLGVDVGYGSLDQTRGSNAMAVRITKSHTIEFCFTWSHLNELVYEDPVTTLTDFLARLHAASTLKNSVLLQFNASFVSNVRLPPKPLGGIKVRAEKGESRRTLSST